MGNDFTAGHTTLLRIAYAYEQHTHHRLPPPD